MKLDIGSGEFPTFPGYIALDNQEDFPNVKNIQREYREAGQQLVIADGNQLPFKDDSFDEIFSNQCVGYYVTAYDEIDRVLKQDGILKLGVWNEKVVTVLWELLILGYKIEDVDIMNGDIDDVREDSSEGTMMITARK